jgi:hypothetical protein
MFRLARGAIVHSMHEDDDSLERAIIGALRATIRDHGPITPDKIGSAAKRILGQLGNARASGLARAMGKRRWAGMSAEDRAAVTSSGGRNAWAGMSPEERSAEMKRRAKKRAAKP